MEGQVHEARKRFLSSHFMENGEQITQHASNISNVQKPIPSSLVTGKRAIYIFSYASEDYWPGIMTQTSQDQLNIPFEQQNLNSLFFYRENYPSTQLDGAF